MTTQFTEKYFYEEICRFRQMFGDKRWWKKTEEQRESCCQALAFIYTNIVNDDGSSPTKEQINSWAMTLDATIIEYERRKVMIALYPPKD